MGLPLQVLKAIHEESRTNRNIKKIALFGRQTVHASSNQLKDLFDKKTEEFILPQLMGICIVLGNKLNSIKVINN